MFCNRLNKDAEDVSEDNTYQLTMEIGFFDIFILHDESISERIEVEEILRKFTREMKSRYDIWKKRQSPHKMRNSANDKRTA